MPEDISNPAPPTDAEFNSAPQVTPQVAPQVKPPTDEEFNAAPAAQVPGTHFLDLPPEVQKSFAKTDPIQTQHDIEQSWDRQDPQWKIPENQAKAAEVWKQLKAESPNAAGVVGHLAKNLPGTAIDMAKSVGGIVGGLGKTILSEAKFYGAKAPAVQVVSKKLFGTDPDSPENRIAREKEIAESIAASETSGLGLAGGLSTLGKKVMEITGQAPSPKDYTPATAQADMMADLGLRDQMKRIREGKGEFLNRPEVGKYVMETLNNQGIKLNPGEIEAKAAGDPITLGAFGGLMNGASAGLKAAIPEIVGKFGTAALSDLGDAAKTIVGKGAEMAGKAAQGTAKGLNVAGKIAPAVGGLLALGKGVLSGDFSEVLGQATAPYIAGRVMRGLSKPLKRGAEALTNLGGDIASEGPATSNLGQVGRDVLEKLPVAAAKTAEGAAFDVGFNQATEELPAEKEHPLQIGTGLGALGALKTMGRHIISGQLIAPRGTGPVPSVPPTRTYGGIETAHENAYATATPASQAFVNTARQLLGSVGAKADVFLTGPETDAELAKMGVSEQMRKQIAENRAVTLRTDDGHSVILLNDPSDAPHEAMHAIDHAAGPDATDALNKSVIDSYGKEQFNQIVDHQADILGGQGDNVHQKILNATGAGNDSAKAKLREQLALADYTTRGEQIKPADLDRAVNDIWAEHAKNNPDAYKDFLTPEEQKESAERYVASEIRAENFDALVKHTGASLTEPKGIIPATTRAIGKAMSLAGVNPLEGRSSEGQKYPLKREIVEQQRGATQKLQDVVTPPQRQTLSKPVVESESPDKDATDARKIANEAPTTPAVKGGEPQNEILGKMADAIASRGGVAIQHSGAPDEPAASISSDRTIRRQIIEAYRNVPQIARAMWPKTFFPNKIVRRGTGIQVQGWAPEVFSANAQKLAEFFAKTAPGEIPYDVDTNAKSLSEQGWKDFFRDVTKIAIPNYNAGRTASGVELQVPRDLILKRGWTKPPLKPAAGKLNQAKADFINMAFGFKTPDSPRISSGKLPQNIAAQEISRATIPGRVEETVRPRGSFGSMSPKNKAAAEALGIEGEHIREVNPLVNKIADIAAKHNSPAPSLIEAWQNLNLENIKSAEHAPEQPEFRGNTAAVVSGFQPATVEAPRRALKPGQREVELTGPDGKQYKALFDGYQERGQGRPSMIQFTPQENGPGISRGSTLFDSSLEKLGFSIPEVPSEKEWEAERAAAPRFGGLMQFQPSKEPEAIKEAAVQRPDGKIFTGPVHFRAYEKASEEPGHNDTEFLHYKEGFVTNKGEFLDRQAALKRAHELGQVKNEDIVPILEKSGQSPTDKHPGLEATTFNEVRQFQPAPPIDSEEFKRWFSGSVVRDQDGAPKLLYHGTIHKINEVHASPHQPFWLSDNPKIAELYADRSAYSEAGKFRQYEVNQRYHENNYPESRRFQEDENAGVDEFNPRYHSVDPTGQNLVPVYAKISSPLDLTGLGDTITDRDFLEEMKKRGLMNESVQDALDFSGHDPRGREQASIFHLLEEYDFYPDIAKSGKDGVIIMDVDPTGRPHRAWGVFDGKHIKSALADPDAIQPRQKQRD